MNCNEALEKIASCNTLDELREEALKSHLEHCEACRIFAEEWMVLKDVRPDGAEPSLSTDFVIKREAQRFVDNRIIRRGSLIRWFTIATAAACVLLGFMMVYSMLKDHMDAETRSSQNQHITQNDDILVPEKSRSVPFKEEDAPTLQKKKTQMVIKDEYAPLLPEKEKIKVVKTDSPSENKVESDTLTPEMIQFLEDEMTAAGTKTANTTSEKNKDDSGDWKSLDFSNDFFELETKLTLCDSSF